MMRCRTIQFLLGWDITNHRQSKFYLPGYLILQPINRYKINFKEKASLLFQSAKANILFFKYWLFFAMQLNTST